MYYNQLIISEKLRKASKLPTPPPPPTFTHNFTSVDRLNDAATQETIDLINDDEFVPKTFSSSKNNSDRVVIDLKRQTITVPVTSTVEKADIVRSTLIHPNVSFSFVLIFTHLMDFIVVYLAVWRRCGQNGEMG